VKGLYESEVKLPALLYNIKKFKRNIFFFGLSAKAAYELFIQSRIFTNAA